MSRFIPILQIAVKNNYVTGRIESRQSSQIMSFVIAARLRTSCKCIILNATGNVINDRQVTLTVEDAIVIVKVIVIGNFIVIGKVIVILLQFSQGLSCGQL